MEKVTDAHGREVTIDGDTYSCGGVSASFPKGHPRDAALATISAMGPDVPPAEPSIPEAVSALRFRLALQAANLYVAVNSVVETEGGAAAIMWEYATDISRTNTELNRLAAKMGVTDKQLDDLFHAAVSLTL